MSVLFWLDASIAKLTLRLVVHRASVFMLLTLLMIQLIRSDFPLSFLQAYSHSSAPVCCIRIASLLTTFVPLFGPVFF